MIWDNYANRYWIVASENGGGISAFEAGRIHIAVSKTATPTSWSGSQWIKCTTDRDNNPATLPNPDKPPLDVQMLGGGGVPEDEFLHTFPDRPSIALDATYLYICYREGEDPQLNPVDDTIILVFTKANVTSGDPLAPVAVLRVNDMGPAELAVDYEITPGPPKVYVISRGLADLNGEFHNIRVGTVTQVNGVWTYGFDDIDLGTTYAYQDLCSPIPGGKYRVVDGQGACQGGLLDDGNHANSTFWSCVTRPYNVGARKIWAVHAVRATGGDCNAVPQTVLQFYEISLGAPPTVTTTRLTLPDGDHAHDPSVAINETGDVIITFNRSYADTSKYPDIYRFTRPYGGSFGNPTLEKAGPSVAYRPQSYGQGPVAPFWADFTGTEPDPVDVCQFWSHHLTAFATADPACSFASQKWQSWLLRFRAGCPPEAMHGNLDMNLDGVLTDDDVAIYSDLAADGDPEMDRTYEGETDVIDFLDFMLEWNEQE